LDTLTRWATASIELPPGYRIEISGDRAEQQRAIHQLLTYVPALAILMIATLVLSEKASPKSYISE
jgi:Cu/Ag efflux pump CusA